MSTLFCINFLQFFESFPQSKKRGIRIECVKNTTVLYNDFNREKCSECCKKYIKNVEQKYCIFRKNMLL